MVHHTLDRRRIKRVCDMAPPEYLSLADHCIAAGRPIPAPETVAQLQALAAEYPDRVRRYLPIRRGLRQMGLSPYLGRDVPPFAPEWRERFLATLVADEDFAQAVGRLIGGAA